MSPEHRAFQAEHETDDNVVKALLNVVINPMWADVLSHLRELADIKEEALDLEKRRVAAYEQRTSLLQEQVIPRLVPVAVAFLAVLIAYLATQLGVPVPGLPAMAVPAPVEDVVPVDALESLKRGWKPGDEPSPQEAQEA